MAIYKRVSESTGKASWQVVVSEQDPVTGKRKRTIIGTYRLKKEADAAERAALNAKDHGTFVDPSKITLYECVQDWLATKKAEVSTNSLYEYRIAAEKHIYPVLGSVAIQKLTHPTLQKQVAAWTGADMSASLVRRCVSVLKQSLALARRGNLIHTNPADDLKQPAKVQKKDLVVWTPGEIARFLEASEADYYSPLWHVLLLEGCRRGEALGLRWQDLDLEKGRATFLQTVIPDVTNKGAAIIQDRTKTRAGTRTIHLTKATTEKLRYHRDQCRFRLKEDWDPSALVFTTSKGTPINPTSVKRNLGIILRAGGVPMVTTHDLRHIAATRMLSAGVPVAMVSQKLGHASVSITTDIYAHFIPDDQALASDAMDALLAIGKVAMNA